MNSNGNGSMKLVYIIMGGLLTIVLSLFSWAANNLDARLSNVEQTQRQRGDRIITFEGHLSNFCEKLCNFDRKLDDFREVVTKKTVFRQECRCPTFDLGN